MTTCRYADPDGRPCSSCRRIRAELASARSTLVRVHCSSPGCATCYSISTLSGVAKRRGDKLVEDHPTMPPHARVLELAAQYVADLGDEDSRPELADICATWAVGLWAARSLRR